MEHKAANTLNAVIILFLSAALAVFAVWSASIFLERAIPGGLDFTWNEIMATGQLLGNVFLLYISALGLRFGYRMLVKPDR